MPRRPGRDGGGEGGRLSEDGGAVAPWRSGVSSCVKESPFVGFGHFASQVGVQGLRCGGANQWASG